jgi:uncharacterized protein (UPF0332 family)
MDAEYLDSLWERAVRTLENAKANIGLLPDTAANRAYYAAFFAVSALFAHEGKLFKKHSGLRSAVHRDLINTRRWPVSLGDDYDTLMDLRELADYGALKHVGVEEAEDAARASERILRAVHDAQPEIFPLWFS